MRPLLPLALLTLCSTCAVLPAQDTPPRWVTPAVRAPRVERQTFDSQAAGTKVSYHLYKPAAYGQDETRRFPVLYWLHGTGGGLGGIARLSATFDSAITAGKLPPLLIVFPNGLPTGMWCDSKDGKTPVETILIKELIPHVDASCRTLAAREGRIIEGFSMGGYGAGRLGFKYPETFCATSMLAAGPLDLQLEGPRAAANRASRDRLLNTVYGGDLDYYKAQSPWVLAETHAAALKPVMLLRQIVGGRDNMLALNRDFDAHLAQLDIPHTFTVLPNVGHDTLAVIEALGDKNWDFYRRALDPVNPTNVIEPTDPPNQPPLPVTSPPPAADSPEAPHSPAPPSATR